MPVVEMAVALLESGFVPVPLLPGKKHIDVEATGRKAHHFRTRSKQMKNLVFASLTTSLADFPPTKEEVGRWFQSGVCNIGLIGGFGNLAVLDFDDTRSYERFSAQNRTLASVSPTARTPDGFHVYVRSKDPMISSSLYCGMKRVGHVKALGGYVVCPPSVLSAGGRYSWAQGKSAFDCQPPLIPDLDSLGLSSVSLVKRLYDDALGRGGFVDR
jgi:Bifunctional DNA primase/polymerase, N-terminal